MLTMRHNFNIYIQVAGFEDMISYNDWLQFHDIELITILPSVSG